MRTPEKYRISGDPAGPGEIIGGAFKIPCGARTLMVIASNGAGWDHVSVSLRDRTPTWDELCFIKSLFWEPEETVVQFHPKVSAYVNVMPHCLHLWKKQGAEHELPPGWMLA